MVKSVTAVARIGINFPVQTGPHTCPQTVNYLVWESYETDLHAKLPGQMGTLSWF